MPVPIQADTVVTTSTTGLILTVSGSMALLLAAVVAGTDSLWLVWAIVTVGLSGLALLRENWGRYPPSDGP